MRVIQTELPEHEYLLLARFARENGKTIGEVVRELVRDLILPDTVRACDPIFHEPPVGTRRGTNDTTSIDHDRVLREGR